MRCDAMPLLYSSTIHSRTEKEGERRLARLRPLGLGGNHTTKYHSMKKAKLFPYLSSRKDGAHAPSRWYVGLQNRPIKRPVRGPVGGSPPSYVPTYHTSSFTASSALPPRWLRRNHSPIPPIKPSTILPPCLENIPSLGRVGGSRANRRSGPRPRDIQHCRVLLEAVPGGTLCVHYTILLLSLPFTTVHCCVPCLYPFRYISLVYFGVRRGT